MPKDSRDNACSLVRYKICVRTTVFQQPLLLFVRVQPFLLTKAKLHYVPAFSERINVEEYKHCTSIRQHTDGLFQLYFLSHFSEEHTAKFLFFGQLRDFNCRWIFLLVDRVGLGTIWAGFFEAAQKGIRKCVHTNLNSSNQNLNNAVVNPDKFHAKVVSCIIYCYFQILT